MAEMARRICFWRPAGECVEGALGGVCVGGGEWRGKVQVGSTNEVSGIGSSIGGGGSPYHQPWAPASCNVLLPFTYRWAHAAVTLARVGGRLRGGQEACVGGGRAVSWSGASMRRSEGPLAQALNARLAPGAYVCVLQSLLGGMYRWIVDNAPRAPHRMNLRCAAQMVAEGRRGG